VRQAKGVPGTAYYGSCCMESPCVGQRRVPGAGAGGGREGGRDGLGSVASVPSVAKRLRWISLVLPTRSNWEVFPDYSGATS
jgi:hypothetical protein